MAIAINKAKNFSLNALRQVQPMFTAADGTEIKLAIFDDGATIMLETDERLMVPQTYRTYDFADLLKQAQLALYALNNREAIAGQIWAMAR